MKLYFILLAAGMAVFLFCGASAASEVSVELPDTPLSVGVTTTVPVVITSVDKLETFTFTIPNTIPGVDVAINESATNALRSGYYINNAFSATERKILWFSTSSVDGEKVILFYLDITPSKEVTEKIPFTLNLDDIGVNGEVSPVTSYIVPQEGVQQTAVPPSASPTTVYTKPASTRATPDATMATVHATQAQTSAPVETPSAVETIPLSSMGSSSPQPTASPIGLFAILTGMAAVAVFAGRRR